MSLIHTPSLSPCARARLRLLGCLLLVAAVALVGGAVTAPAIPGWYQGLVKPAWTPPNPAFPVAWSVLYLLMGLALFRLWDRVPPSQQRSTAIRLFLAQLALNALWSPVFFGLHAPRAGLAVIAVLIVVLALAVRAAFRVDRTAGGLLVPYLAWVCYASTLNAAIVVLN
ncbi:tryptophan-rich sensory protein [Xanthobacter dioxanivorans]|uniref:Tryptophan-rich sensory protein n=1 Tax=Xanthobacter dioxanivorans TaxID=2528964 RepID=A0A974SLM8_9HYPH|nr:TspO/MBR family protein [Xanthobacter dioxanivorans]QRG09519.1 tryptophan-rich sensory protein [Xanthobacter dioxanivorans]